VVGGVDFGMPLQTEDAAVGGFESLDGPVLGAGIDKI